MSEGMQLSCVQGFTVLFLCIILQGWLTHYANHREKPASLDKLYTLVTIHYILAVGTALLLWISFIALIAVCASATGFKATIAERPLESGGIRISYGSSVWLVLVAAILGILWGWEAMRWRQAEFNRNPS
jgi:hypothetical protein